MKVQQAIDQFRRYIQDTQKTRYADGDTAVTEYFRAAFRKLWDQHRHMFYVARIVNRIPDLPARIEGGLDLELLPAAEDKLAHYMAYMALMEDAEDAHNIALAREHLMHFGAP